MNFNRAQNAQYQKKEISISSLLLLSFCVRLFMIVCVWAVHSETINGMKVNVNPIGMPLLIRSSHSLSLCLPISIPLSVYLSILWSLLSEILSYNTSKSDSVIQLWRIGPSGKRVRACERLKFEREKMRKKDPSKEVVVFRFAILSRKFIDISFAFILFFLLFTRI